MTGAGDILQHVTGDVLVSMPDAFTRPQDKLLSPRLYPGDTTKVNKAAWK